MGVVVVVVVGSWWRGGRPGGKGGIILNPRHDYIMNEVGRAVHPLNPVDP